jgi:transcription-repair coupling factor (superfamily II helicase)
MKIMQFLQTETNKAKLKQVGKNGILVVSDITSMEKLLAFVQKMHAFAVVKNNEPISL